ncbi:hypothetical protein ACWGI0_02145, partial [Streptomyces sp. NPDC054802]
MTLNDEGREMTEPRAADGDHDRGDRALLPTATGAQTFAAVRTLLRGHRLLTVLAVTVLVTGTGIGLLTAPLLGRIVDLVAGQRGTATAAALYFHSLFNPINAALFL